MPLINVRTYTHPNWDMSLIVKDSDFGASVAEELLDCEDVELLAFTVSSMTQEAFEDLPEWER